MAGWTQYTGASGWYYRLLLEDMLGYRECGDSFTLEPCPELPNRLELKIERKATVYRITFVSGTSAGIPASEPTHKKAARFPYDGKEHTLTYYFGT